MKIGVLFSALIKMMTTIKEKRQSSNIKKDGFFRNDGKHFWYLIFEDWYLKIGVFLWSVSSFLLSKKNANLRISKNMVSLEIMENNSNTLILLKWSQNLKQTITQALITQNFKKKWIQKNQVKYPFRKDAAIYQVKCSPVNFAGRAFTSVI